VGTAQVDADDVGLAPARVTGPRVLQLHPSVAHEVNEGLAEGQLDVSLEFGPTI
jgi:hypothetical protein